MARKNQPNPYGSGPGMGATLPDYYQPTEYVKNNQVFFPGLEEVEEEAVAVA
jgi:hypothetical protein